MLARLSREDLRLAVGFVAPVLVRQPPTTVPNFFDFAWPSAPAGPYTVFMAFTVPGSLADASIGPSDIVVIASDTLTFSP